MRMSWTEFFQLAGEGVNVRVRKFSGRRRREEAQTSPGFQFETRYLVSCFQWQTAHDVQPVQRSVAAGVSPAQTSVRANRRSLLRIYFSAMTRIGTVPRGHEPALEM